MYQDAASYPCGVRSTLHRITAALGLIRFRPEGCESDSYDDIDHELKFSIVLSSFKKTIQLMYSKIDAWIEFLFPTLNTDEKISYNYNNLLELLFFTIVNGIRRLGNSKKEYEYETFFDKLINMLMIFLLLLCFVCFVIALPLISSPETVDLKINSIYGYFIISLFVAISWAGFVYLSQD